MSTASKPPTVMYTHFSPQHPLATPDFRTQDPESSTTAQPQGVVHAAGFSFGQQQPGAIPGVPPWAMMPGILPFGMGEQFPMSSAPQAHDPSHTNWSPAQQQALMYQRYLHAVALGQLVPGGPGWPLMPPAWRPSWMYVDPGSSTPLPPPHKDGMPMVPDQMSAPPYNGGDAPPYNPQNSCDAAQVAVRKAPAPAYNQLNGGDATRMGNTQRSVIVTRVMPL